jgi:hypothetical protein
MAYETGDGFKSTNRAPMMAHKRSMERKSLAGGAGMSQKVDPLQQPTDGGGEEDGSAVAQEHGPAVEVNITHQAGQHSVHSSHPDGHEHHSEHASAEEAHEQGKKLAGVGAQDDVQDQGDDAEYE